MKTKRLLCFCLALLAVGTVETQAQGLGGLLKKVKKGVEAIAGQPQPETQQSTAKKARGSETPVEGGGTHHQPHPRDCRPAARGRLRQEHVGQLR